MRFYKKKDPDKAIKISKEQVCEVASVMSVKLLASDVLLCSEKQPYRVILSKNVYCYC